MLIAYVNTDRDGVWIFLTESITDGYCRLTLTLLICFCTDCYYSFNFLTNSSSCRTVFFFFHVPQRKRMTNMANSGSTFAKVWFYELLFVFFLHDQTWFLLYFLFVILDFDYIFRFFLRFLSQIKQMTIIMHGCYSFLLKFGCIGFS